LYYHERVKPRICHSPPALSAKQLQSPSASYNAVSTFVYSAMASHPVRQPAVAGLFYPADPRALAGQVHTLLAQAPQADASSPPKALIVPHAGYMYSGATAAAAFSLLKTLRDSIRRVVLLGPSHRFAFEGVALPTACAFATPLGTVELDSEAVFKLAESSDVVIDDRAHVQEHALEVVLPFLQIALGHFQIVPLVAGQISADALADVLDVVWGGPETLIVVSSDLSHYHAYTEAQETDRQTTELILAMQPTISQEQACGATAINALLLSAQRHRNTPHLLASCNSGDTAGDRMRVVGYTAVSFSATPHTAH